MSKYSVLFVVVVLLALVSPLFANNKDVVAQSLPVVSVTVGETKVVVQEPTSVYVPSDVPVSDMQVVVEQTVLGEEFKAIDLESLDNYVLDSTEIFAYISVSGGVVNLGVFTLPDVAHYIVSKPGAKVNFFVATGSEAGVIESMKVWCLSANPICVY